MPRTQVAIIGAGLAGILAAVAASRAGARVLLIDRGGMGLGSNSAMSNGNFGGPTAQYALDNYVEDTLRAGRGLCRASWVRRVGQELPASFAFMGELGVELSDHGDSYLSPTHKQDGFRGAWFMATLAARLRDEKNLERLAKFQVRRILTRDGRAVGLEGRDAQGRLVRVAASAVVLAAGGAGAVYAVNDNMKAIMGQGYALAAQAGLPLWDMEFVQFYPLVLVEPGLPRVMLYPRYPQGTRLINAAGQDLLARSGIVDVNQGIMELRDRLSAAMAREAASGPVRVDFTGVAEEHWSRYPLAMLGKMRFDFRRKPVAVMPGAHFCMGGVKAKPDGATALPGLFACGEMLWGMHGANRRGGNALTECVVSGRLTGLGAAAYALTQDAPPAVPEAPADDGAPEAEKGMTELRALRQKLRDIAWQRAGIERREEDLALGHSELTAWHQELAATPVGGARPDWLRWDLECGGRFLSAVLTASRARRETRGALLRSDHPQTDDAAWLVNSRLEAGADGGWSLSHHAVEA
ncbi:FAD-binding protein [Desulfoferula mesophila]|uniref:L-aspartate oxidase n=1 Tax=Desulfoferula mesophila TaxID=3058419 RepID=A0AAU9EER7_9BACT|nr:L-aspartate oxidase [Desulfoferula mesophilus]